MRESHHAALARLERLEDWLFGSALPLWWRTGADHAGGGFFEGIELDGRASLGARRVRVQARQVFVYVTAGELGWTGPWSEAARHGLEFLLQHYQQADGLYRPYAEPERSAHDAQLYDQAFVLLALAFAKRGRLIEDAETRALGLLDAMDRELRHDGGAYREADEARPFQSNPLMHLFESALAWSEVSSLERWRELARELADLAMNRFVSTEAGMLREFFDAGWRPASGMDGRRVEPGHQFEWAWLLQAWSRGSLDGAQAAVCSEALWRAGRRFGIDHGRGVAINAVLDDGTPQDLDARLWPQTERLRTAALYARLVGEAEPDAWAELAAAADGLLKYLDTPVRGLWRDKLKADGDFVVEPAPASSFYHIIGAIHEFQRSLASVRAGPEEGPAQASLHG